MLGLCFTIVAGMDASLRWHDERRLRFAFRAPGRGLGGAGGE